MRTDELQLDRSFPLVADLDGTLVRTDLLWETLALFLRRHLLQAWRLPFWLLLGKAAFKERLARAVALDPAALPYDQQVLDLVAQARASGRTTVLATGAQRTLAEQVAAHTGLFDLVLATEDINLTSHNKAQRLAALYGEQGFDYIGNSRADLPVWRHSRNAWCVAGKCYALGDGRRTEHAGRARTSMARAFVKGLRPRQWLKNLLVFVPMLSAHALAPDMLALSLLAFVAFCACASSAYLLNDALDAQDDRHHPTKHTRPIAAGTLPLAVALAASPLLALAAFAACALLKPLLLLPLGVYFVATVAYSLVLKRLAMVDIVTLALLYSLRVLGGSAATGIEPSFWLLAFSFFMFLSLALLKRHSELFNLHHAGKDKTRGRGYTTADQAPIGVMGINAAFLSVLIFLLYVNSHQVVKLYRHPDWLLGIVPLLVFWLGRLWMLGYRGQVNEDPLLYVSHDRASLAVLLLCAGLAAGAA